VAEFIKNCALKLVRCFFIRKLCKSFIRTHLVAMFRLLIINRLYVSSSNSKFLNAKISNVTLPTFKCSNGHFFEWAKVRHVISSNSMFPKCQIVEQKNVRTISLMTQPYWAALFSDNFALRGIFRLG
jgi:hypothetical protein